MSTNSEFEAGLWKISVVKKHILRSICEKKLPEGCDLGSEDICTVCRYGKELTLPSLPEMVFPESMLKLEHKSGCVLEFVTLDALKLVNATQETLKVAAAEDWSKTRAVGLREVNESVKPFDWTYTTDYKGTLTSNGGASFQVCDTDERIDYGILKMQEKIFFYDEVILYEDELADNGTAVLNVKIRVMASGFFILLRFFLRVDGVLVRMNETRFHHRAESDYLLREYTSKEAKMANLKVNTSALTEPNTMSDVLPVEKLIVHKLVLPKPNLQDPPS